jgi:predicted RNA-binding protein
MSNQINLWSHLPDEIQNELIKVAEKIGVETIYIFRRPYYQRRNSLILKRYYQLRSKNNQSLKEIYEQIAREVSKFSGNISIRAVEHVIKRNPPAFSPVDGG